MTMDEDQEMSDLRWLNDLADAFDDNGTIGGKILPLIGAENSHAEYVATTFHGYQILSDSFFSFFLTTMNTAAEQLASMPEENHPTWYRNIFVNYAGSFKSLRAAEHLLLNGYPTVGFGLLRDLKDRAITLAAIVNGKTDYLRSQGYEIAFNRSAPLTEKDENTIRRSRKAEEQRIRKLMVGNSSGLSETIRNRFSQWEAKFHLEVHGGRFTTFTDILAELNQSGRFTLLPIPKNLPIAMFLNTSNPIKWMWVRLLPFLQIEPVCFGGAWVEQWKTIDKSFEGAMESWTDVQEGDLPEAITCVISECFGFDAENTHYVPQPSPDS